MVFSDKGKWMIHLHTVRWWWWWCMNCSQRLSHGKVFQCGRERWIDGGNHDAAGASLTVHRSVTLHSFHVVQRHWPGIPGLKPLNWIRYFRYIFHIWHFSLILVHFKILMICWRRKATENLRRQICSRYKFPFTTQSRSGQCCPHRNENKGAAPEINPIFVHFPR